MKWKLGLMIIASMLLVGLASASFGYNNPYLPFITPEETAGTTSVNYSEVNVNNSQYLQGYTPTTLKDWIQGLFNSVYYGIDNPNGYYNSTTIPETNLTPYALLNGSNQPFTGDITAPNLFSDLKKTIYVIAPLDNIIPNMTSNTTPSGIANCSDIISGTYDCWKAFDGIDRDDSASANAWFSATKATNPFPKWLQYKFDTGKVINRYVVHNRGGAGNDNRKPANWTFIASNDSLTWTILDTQINQFNASSGYSNGTYNFTNTNSYTYYRINISANWGADYVTIGELEMFTPVNGSNENIYSVKVENSTIANEYGITTIGNDNGRTIIRGSNMTALGNFTITNRVGIGTASPTYALDVPSASMFGTKGGAGILLANGPNDDIQFWKGGAKQAVMAHSGGALNIVITYGGFGIYPEGVPAGYTGGFALTRYGGGAIIGTGGGTGNALAVSRGIYTPGRGTNTAGGTIVTGSTGDSGTDFTNRYRVGDTITMVGETQTITGITNDTSLNTTAWTNAHTSQYITTTSTIPFVIKFGGNVGINTITPQQRLDVNGTIKLSEMLLISANTTAMTCSTAYAGAIYYDGTTYTHYGCNSTDWRALY